MDCNNNIIIIINSNNEDDDDFCLVLALWLFFLIAMKSRESETVDDDDVNDVCDALVSIHLYCQSKIIFARVFFFARESIYCSIVTHTNTNTEIHSRKLFIVLFFPPSFLSSTSKSSREVQWIERIILTTPRQRIQLMLQLLALNIVQCAIQIIR